MSSENSSRGISTRTPLSSKKLARLGTVLLFAAPLFFFCLIPVTRRSPEGASFYLDPDWYYIYNGLKVALGERAFFFDHPGLPLQFLAGLLIRARWAILPYGNEGLVKDVLLHPAQYHRDLGNMALAINTFFLLLFGTTLRKWKFPLWLALFAQWIFLTIPSVWVFSGRWLPEGLGLTLGICGSLFWLRAFTEREAGSPLRLGIFLGLANSIKLNFFPYAVLALLSRRWRSGLLAAFVAGVTFFATTLLLPADRRNALFGYFFAMTTHSGLYSSGEVGFPGFEQLVKNALFLWNENALWTARIIVANGLALLIFARALFWRDRKFRWNMLIALSIFLLNTVATLKHPWVRYFIPSMMFLPAMLAAFALFEKKRWIGALPLLVWGIWVCFSWNRYLEEIGNLNAGKRLSRVWESEAAAALQGHENCLLLVSSGSSNNLVGALGGNAQAGQYFDRELAELYPHFWTVSPDFKAFHRFADPVEKADYERAKSTHSCLIFEYRTDYPLQLKRQVLGGLKTRVLFTSDEIEILFADLRKK